MFEKPPLKTENAESKEPLVIEAEEFDELKMEVKTHPEKEMREAVFAFTIYHKLIDTFHKTLIDANFSTKQIAAIEKKFHTLSSEEGLGVLAIPSELRDRMAANYKNKISKGDITPEGMVSELLERSQREGYTVGYHFSRNDIKPVTKKNFGKTETSWDIIGYEMDDRDNMKMAYYSLDYKNLYRDKSAKYLYLVRAITKPGGAHKRDLNNNWGRAATISIIDRIDLSKENIDEKVATLTKKVSQTLQKEDLPAQAA